MPTDDTQPPSGPNSDAWRRLRETYGQGASDKILNRALRAEMPGGADLLDAINAANRGELADASQRLAIAAASLRDPLAIPLIAAARELLTLAERDPDARPLACQALAIVRDRLRYRVVSGE